MAQTIPPSDSKISRIGSLSASRRLQPSSDSDEPPPMKPLDAERSRIGASVAGLSFPYRLYSSGSASQHSPDWRSADMQGHIRKRTHKTKDGRTTVNWYVVIELERDADGKRRQKWYGGYRTRKEAEAARIEILHEINTGTFVEPTKTTLEEWALRTWLPLIADRVKPSTLDSYRLNLELHVLPTLGRRQVRQLTPAMLNQLYAELLDRKSVV